MNKIDIPTIPINYDELNGKPIYGKTAIGNEYDPVGNEQKIEEGYPPKDVKGYIKQVGAEVFFCSAVGATCWLLTNLLTKGGRTKHRRKSNRKHSKTKRK